MRLLSLILLFALSLTLLASPGQMQWSLDESGTAVIATFDVCHKSGGFSMPTWDMPALQGQACMASPYDILERHASPATPSLASLFDFREEHPPRS